MGTADLAERALIQGLIKVAAADVHAVRGNPAGVRRNLEGARERLDAGPRGLDHRCRGSTSVGCWPSIDARLATLDATRRRSARRSRSTGGAR